MKIRRIAVVLLLAIALLVLGLFIRIDYYLMLPSRAVNLNSVIAVENGDVDDEGYFYLVTVSQRRASLTSALYGKIHPHIDINPAGQVIPEDMDEKEYRELLSENMIESQHIAQVVALRRSGYDVEIISEGVEIIHIIEDAAAQGYLLEKDIILTVDDRQVNFSSEVPLIVKDRQVGETVGLEVRRNNETINLNVPTGANPEDENSPFLGIYIKTRPWEPLLPVNISMNTGNIGGPSAGVMFVLEIINQLTADDLTAGYKIAGTGTIDIEENVGKIGGITQKVIAAEKTGADYFILPEGNYEQAQKIASKVELVPVNTLDDILLFLTTLEGPNR